MPGCCTGHGLSTIRGDWRERCRDGLFADFARQDKPSILKGDLGWRSSLAGDDLMFFNEAAMQNGPGVVSTALEQ